MPVPRRLFILTACVLLAAPFAIGQGFNCNGTCEPDPSSPTYQSTVSSRTLVQEGTIEHEGLHNYLKIGDLDLQAKLGLPANASDTTNITQAMRDHKCTH